MGGLIRSIAIELNRFNMASNSESHRGIVRGKMIELDQETGMPDGQEVVVIVQSASAAAIPWKPGDGIRRSAGGWSDDVQGLDEFLVWNRQQRKQGRARDLAVSYLIDTNICSAHLKQSGAITSKFLQHSGRLHISTVTVGELYTWALRAKARASGCSHFSISSWMCRSLISPNRLHVGSAKCVLHCWTRAPRPQTSTY